MTTFRKGIVEGFYGKPWTWQERSDTAGFMANAGFTSYLYAPKGDAFLRRRWREPWPPEALAKLNACVTHFHSLGLAFGVGLSPVGDHAESDFRKKIEELALLDIDHIALLFDDMKGDEPGLAAKQVKMAHAVKARWGKGTVSLCPTYYSLDPVLDRIFGQRPPEYLHELGQSLDPTVEVFWTGERICSRSYSLTHLEQVSTILQRKPLLWDNYPVNDTQTMSKFLHLKPFTGRPVEMSQALCGHLINPMLQPVLSRIPAITLYAPEMTFEQAATVVVGRELAACITRDLELFHEQGLGGIDPHKLATLRAEYSRYQHPAAHEIVAWLDGAFAVTNEMVLAQQ